MLADRPHSNTDAELNKHYPHHIARPEIANRMLAISYEFMEPDLEGTKWIRNIFEQNFLRNKRN